MAILRKSISGADLRSKFFQTSQAWGYTVAKQAVLMADIAQLLALWRGNKWVEIYTLTSECQHGRIKSSRFNAAGQETPCYALYFHTRARPDAVDPLLIVTFDDIPGNEPCLMIETIINHKNYFGDTTLLAKSRAQIARRSEDVNRRVEYGKKLIPPLLSVVDEPPSEPEE